MRHILKLHGNTEGIYQTLHLSSTLNVFLLFLLNTIPVMKATTRCVDVVLPSYLIHVPCVF